MLSPKGHRTSLWIWNVQCSYMYIATVTPSLISHVITTHNHTYMYIEQHTHLGRTRLTMH